MSETDTNWRFCEIKGGFLNWLSAPSAAVSRSVSLGPSRLRHTFLQAGIHLKRVSGICSIKKRGNNKKKSTWNTLAHTVVNPGETARRDLKGEIPLLFLDAPKVK